MTDAAISTPAKKKKKGGRPSAVKLLLNNTLATTGLIVLTLIVLVALAAQASSLPAGCGDGEISWTSVQPISVSLEIDGLLSNPTYTASGTSGSLPFSLSVLDIYDVDYHVVVQPLASFLPMPATGLCTYTYNLNFLIP